MNGFLKIGLGLGGVFVLAKIGPGLVMAGPGAVLDQLNASVNPTYGKSWGKPSPQANVRASGSLAGATQSDLRAAASEAVSEQLNGELQHWGAIKSKFFVWVAYPLQGGQTEPSTNLGHYGTEAPMHAYARQQLPYLNRGDAQQNDPFYMALFELDPTARDFRGNPMPKFIGDDLGPGAAAQLSPPTATKASGSIWNATAKYGA